MREAARLAVVRHPYLIAAASLAFCAIAASVAFGTGIEGLQAVTRYTGRAGLFLFGFVFALAPWRRLWPSPFVNAAFRERRHFGLAFGAHHTVHLALLASYLARSGAPVHLSRIAAGALAYLALFVMMATSTDSAVRRIGAARWRTLHRTCLWYLWLVFVLTYVPRILGTAQNAGGGMAEFIFCLIVLFALATLRLAAFSTKKIRAHPSAAVD